MIGALPGPVRWMRAAQRTGNRSGHIVFHSLPLSSSCSHSFANPPASGGPLGALRSGIRFATQAVQQHAIQFGQTVQRFFRARAAGSAEPAQLVPNTVTPSQGATLAELPVFVLEHVAGFLPWRDAQRLATLVCSSLHHALAQDARLCLVVINACTGWSLNALRAATAQPGKTQAPTPAPAMKLAPAQAQRLITPAGSPCRLGPARP